MSGLITTGDPTSATSSNALAIPKTYKVDHPALQPLASGTPEYSAPIAKAGSVVSLEDVDNAEKQYKTRRALQLAGLATMDEVLAAKKREYELLAENAGSVIMPDWVQNLQQQLQTTMAHEVRSLQSQQQQQSAVSVNDNHDDEIQQLALTTQAKNTALLQSLESHLQNHSSAMEQQLHTVTHQLNQIGQTLIQETVRNMNRLRVKNDTDPVYPLPILESSLRDDVVGHGTVIYPKDKGLWFPERLCQIKVLPRGVKYPAYPHATEYQIDQLLEFYDITIKTGHLRDLEVPDHAIAKEILRYKQEALYHYLGVEWC